MVFVLTYKPQNPWLNKHDNFQGSKIKKKTKQNSTKYITNKVDRFGLKKKKQVAFTTKLTNNIEISIESNRCRKNFHSCC